MSYYPKHIWCLVFFPRPNSKSKGILLFQIDCYLTQNTRSNIVNRAPPSAAIHRCLLLHATIWATAMSADELVSSSALPSGQPTCCALACSHVAAARNGTPLTRRHPSYPHRGDASSAPSRPLQRLSGALVCTIIATSLDVSADHPCWLCIIPFSISWAQSRIHNHGFVTNCWDRISQPISKYYETTTSNLVSRTT